MPADRRNPIAPNMQAPAFGKRKAALFATCFVNYNKPATGMAARAVLNHIGVETRVAYPGCCGMPFLEQADLARVAENAAKVSKELVRLIDEGYDIVALTASCGLMFKFEWPLIVPENEDVKRLADATFDIDEYVVDDREERGLARRPASRCRKASACIWPVTPAPRTWGRRPPRCCASFPTRRSM